MEPSLNPEIRDDFTQLESIVEGFDQESLNDGEAGHIHSLIKKKLDTLLDHLVEVPTLDKRMIQQIEERFHSTDNQFHKIFTEENEKTFSSLREAHEYYNETKREIKLMFHHPDLIDIMAEIDSILEASQEGYSGTAIEEGLSKIRDELNKIMKYIEDHEDILDTDEALWIREYLSDRLYSASQLNQELLRPSKTMDDIRMAVKSIQDTLVESGFEVTD